LASQRSVAQKKQLVEHKADFEKDGRKLPFKDQLAYCQEKGLSSTVSWRSMPASLGQMWSLCFERKIAAPLSKMMIKRLGK